METKLAEVHVVKDGGNLDVTFTPGYTEKLAMTGTFHKLAEMNNHGVLPMLKECSFKFNFESLVDGNNGDGK